MVTRKVFLFVCFKQAKHTKSFWQRIGFKSILQTFLPLKIYLKTSSKIDHKRAILQKVGVFVVGCFFLIEKLTTIICNPVILLVSIFTQHINRFCSCFKQIQLFTYPLSEQ